MTDEPWLQAVADADSTPVAAMTALRGELASLWSDLSIAYRMASNYHWSIGCDDLVARIVHISRVTGPLRWDGPVPLHLTANGVYQGIMAAAGLTVPEPDMGRVAEMMRETGSRQCAECGKWLPNHTLPCALRPRTQYEKDRGI